MKLLFVLIGLLPLSAFSSEVYVCKTNKPVAPIYLKVEGGKQPNLTVVKWGNLFSLSEKDKKNTNIKYSREHNELTVRSSKLDGDSFHIILKKDQYVSLQNLDSNLVGIAYTTNARGFIWVSATEIHCALKRWL